jgi:hypothetical protein
MLLFRVIITLVIGFFMFGTFIVGSVISNDLINGGVSPSAGFAMYGCLVILEVIAGYIMCQFWSKK